MTKRVAKRISLFTGRNRHRRAKENTEKKRTRKSWSLENLNLLPFRLSPKKFVWRWATGAKPVLCRLNVGPAHPKHYLARKGRQAGKNGSCNATWGHLKATKRNLPPNRSVQYRKAMVPKCGCTWDYKGELENVLVSGSYPILSPSGSLRVWPRIGICFKLTELSQCAARYENACTKAFEMVSLEWKTGQDISFPLSPY